MKKRFPLFVSVVLILTLAASFSFPVFAASTSYTWADVGNSSYNVVSNKTWNHVTYKRVIAMDQFLKDSGISWSTKNNTSSTSSASGDLDFAYFTGYVYEVFIPLVYLSTMSDYQYRFLNLSLSYGSYSGFVSNTSPDFALGSYSDVANGSFDAVTVKVSGSKHFYYEGDDQQLIIWLHGYVWCGTPETPSLSVSNVAVSYDGIQRRRFATPVAMNLALNDILSAVTSQTSSLGSAITSQTNSINKTFMDQMKSQTTTLTTGFDNKGMEQSNKDLQDSLNRYDTMEGNLKYDAAGHLNSVSWFVPLSHLQLMTAVTYTSTFLQDLFVALGDWSMLVMMSLSLSFGLMAIGWFKYRR